MIIFLYFKSSIIILVTLFFLSSIVEWNKLSREVRNSKNIRIFKKMLLEFIRPSPNSIFDIYNPYGIKQWTRLRLGLSHLNEHKFKHGFNDTINSICICGGDIESINHFFLHCPHYCDVLNTVMFSILWCPQYCDVLNTVMFSILWSKGNPVTTFKALIKCC